MLLATFKVIHPAASGKNMMLCSGDGQIEGPPLCCWCAYIRFQSYFSIGQLTPGVGFGCYSEIRESITSSRSLRGSMGSCK